MKVTCIIPAYNEETTIKQVILELKKLKEINEIIVVDDGSKDNTYKKAKSLGVIVLRNPKNQGKGAAIKRGIKKATGEIILFFDADIIKLDFSKAKEMIRLIETNNSDVVIGTYNSGYFQSFTEIAYNPLMSLLYPEVNKLIPIGQLSGQRAFRKSILDKIKLTDGFDLETIINIELSRLNPTPRVNFIDFGEIVLKPKGYQTSMEIIVDCILKEAEKDNRLNRFSTSAFICVSEMLTEKLNSIEPKLNNKINEKTIYLVRHGETSYNVKKMFSGRVDMPLTKKGKTQTKRLKKFFKDKKIDSIYSSPLKRSLNTAKVIFENKPIKASLSLQEMDTGLFTSKTHEQVRRDLPNFVSILKTFDNYPEGESIKDVQKRLLPFLKSIKGNSVAIVAHEGINKNILAILLNKDFSKTPFQKNTDIFEIKDNKLKIFSLK